MRRITKKLIKASIRNSPFKKGHTPWNKGKTAENEIPQMHNAGRKKGCTPWNKNTKGYSTSLKGRKRSQEFCDKQSEAQKGKKMPKSYCENLSERMKGSGNPAFKNWATREPYGIEWSEELKEKIRERDSYRCQECFRHQSEFKEKLSIHHINFNKRNNHPSNLISLCRTCHLQTNWGKRDWVTYYQQRLKGEA